MKPNFSKRFRIRNVLIVNDIEISFDYPIHEVLEIGDMLIVRTYGSGENRNVYGVSLLENRVKWRVDAIRVGSEKNCPFVGIKYHGGKLYLNNWCDTYLIINPITGEELERGYAR